MAIWQPEPPATEAALNALCAQAPVTLPIEYIAQLAESNGGEGELGVEPGWIVVWPVEEIVALNEGYQVAEMLPGFWGFGSSGGGELLAFDARNGAPYPVVMVPFIPMNAKHAVQIAASFMEFRQFIGRPLS